MRDLARSGIISRRRGSSKIFLKLIIFGVFILAVFYFVKNGLSGTALVGSSAVLSEAPRGLKPVDVESKSSLGKQGVNLTSQTETLRDVMFGGRATGTATRTFGGGSYTLDVEVKVPTAKGYLFEVWLVDGSGSLREVDFMRCTDTNCNLTLRDTDKYSKYNRIWVTRELTNQDSKPEQHVLEGEW